ncbi:hypothetical protein DAPPUDRAFT_259659 [Daphnia pulex]|uniref:Uncharacterized protein n=1 Tax=Daphnia pulex TaxID=6669 RepID=E9HHL3_DAPPU|nr:hypothetical protein DAPPUDRAFT_259659 [Daphnia pulex]|eukprot:EFX68721.1 hypothetical protein DAPPUDRAFT_259659 [Daphnia pulex]
MPPRRELTREEKDEKNRKAKEKRSLEDPEAKEVRLAAQREKAKFVREEKRRRLNPEDDQAAKNLKSQRAREDRQAEAPDERALRQRLRCNKYAFAHDLVIAMTRCKYALSTWSRRNLINYTAVGVVVIALDWYSKG